MPRSRKKQSPSRKTSALLEAGGPLGQVIDSSADGVAIADFDGTIRYMNPAMASLFGYTPAELTSIADWAVKIFPDARERNHAVSSWKKDAMVRHPPERRFFFTRKDGARRCVRFQLSRVPRQKLILINGQDVTDQVEVEQVLQRTQFAVDHALESILWIGKDGSIKYVNDAACRSLGYTRNELLAKTVHDIDPHFPKSKWAAHWKRTRRRQPSIIETEHRRKSGKCFPVEVSINFLEFEGEEYHCAIARDISERRRARRELQEQGRFLSNLVDTLTEGIMVLDRDFRVTYWSRGMTKLTGVTKKQALGSRKRAWELFPHLKQQGLAKKLRQAMKGQIVHAHHVPFKTPGGKRGFTSDTYHPLRGPDGKVHGLLAVVRDVAEEVAAKKEIEESHAQMASIFRAAPVGIGLAANRVLLDVNDRVCDITGRTKEELIGKDARLLYPSRAEYDRVGKEKYAQIRKKGTGTVETQWKRKNGTIRDILLRSTPLDPKDLSVGVTFTALDITERKLAERALVESEQRYRSFVQGFHGIAYRADIKTWTPLFFHGAVEEITGYTEEEFCQGNPRWDQIIHKDDLRTLKRTYTAEACQKPGFRAEREYRIVRKDGEIRWIQDFVQNVQDTVRGKAFLHGALYDVTERKRAEEITLAQRDLGLAVSATHDLERILQLCLAAALRASGLDGGGIYLVDENTGDLDMVVSSGLSDTFVQEVSRMKAASEQAKLVTRGNPVYTVNRDLVARMDKARKAEGLRALAVIPVRHEDRVVACLNAASHESDDIPPQARVALEAVASQMGTMIAAARVREQLEESRVTMEAIFRTAPVGVGLSIDRRLVQINDRFCELTGYSTSELLGESTRKLYLSHNDMLRIGRENFRQYREKGMGVVETQWKQKGGRLIDVLLISTPLDLDNLATGLVLTVLDITDRKAAERELRELFAAVESAEESIIITDPEGDIQYVNPWFEHMTGYPRKKVLGQNTRIFKSGLHDSEFYAELWNTIRSGRTWRGHFMNRNRDGKVFEEDAVISPVRDADGHITNYVAVKRDVTQEKTLETQVRQAQKMSAIGHLAHRITHSFTNALVVILGNAQLARAQNHDPDTQKHLDEIITSANEISGLTAELLAFAHPTALRVRAMSLDKAMLGIEEILRKTISAEVKLRFELNGKGCRVRVDPNQIEQALLHIVINACEAMSGGGSLTISTEPAVLSAEAALRLQSHVRDDRQHTGRFAIIRVADSGCGMTREVQSHLFEPFFTTKRDERSAGLSLSNVYRIIDQHDGYVTVESRLGQGTTFNIYLPCVE